MQVGRHTYGDPIVRGDTKRVFIGSFCSFAKGVLILSCRDHRTDWISTFPFKDLWGCGNDGHPTGKGNIVIGNDVWVGTNSIILSGVTIGDGAVIGAGSVVARDVAPYTVAAGNPIHEIRKRFSEQVIKDLLELKWWDWSDEKIRDHAKFLTSTPGRWHLDTPRI